MQRALFGLFVFLMFASAALAVESQAVQKAIEQSIGSSPQPVTATASTGNSRESASEGRGFGSPGDDRGFGGQKNGFGDDRGFNGPGFDDRGFGGPDGGFGGGPGFGGPGPEDGGFGGSDGGFGGGQGFKDQRGQGGVGGNGDRGLGGPSDYRPGPSSGGSGGFDGKKTPPGFNGDFDGQIGGDDFGPRPEFGPRFGPQRGAEFPPEAIEGFVFGNIGDKMVEKYGKDAIFAKCANQPELVELMYDEFKQTGTDIKKELCSNIEEGVASCEENKNFCGNIGGEGPRFGPPDEENPVTPTCPPDSAQLLNYCKARMEKEFERNFKEREEDIDFMCEERYDFDSPRFEEMCQGGKMRGSPSCDREQFINECMQNIPSDAFNRPFDEQNQQGPQRPFQPPQPPQPFQPPQSSLSCPQRPNLPQEWYNSCSSGGGRVEERKDSQGCVINLDCVYTQPAVQPIQSVSPPPSVTVAPQVSAQPQDTSAPTLAPTPEPKATQEPAARTPEPTSIPEVQNTAKTSAKIISGFFSASSPREACEQEWNRNSERFARQCEREKSRGPSFDVCSKDAFMANCRQESLKNMAKDRERMTPEKMCKYEIKRMTRDLERFCKDMARGKDQCLKDTERGCEFGRKQLARCQELTQPEKLKEVITKAVAKGCKKENSRRRITLTSIDPTKLSPSDVVPAIVAVREDVSSDQVRELERTVDRVEGFYTLAGLRIYSVAVKAGDFPKIKALPFVSDAKIDSIRSSVEAYEKKEGNLEGLDKAVTTLEATQQLLPSTESQLVGYETENLEKTKEKIAEVSKDKGVSYAMQQFLGFKADEERKESEALEDESKRLLSTTSRLRSLAEQVDDVNLQAVIMEQVKDLESQQKSIHDRAEAKRRGASGLLSLFGLLG